MIDVATKPNSIGNFRYDVRAAGRSTHGFRPTPQAAREAGREDQELLFFAARSERVDEDDKPVGKDRTTRRESVK